MDKRAFTKHISALLLFGLNGAVATRIDLNSYEIVFLRTLIGGALLVALFLLSRGRFTMGKNRRDAAFVFLSGIAMGVGWMFMYEGYVQIGVGLTTLLCYCGPVIVMILSPLLFKEKIRRPVIIAFAVVMTGMVLVSGGLLSEGNSAFGIFCGIMSAVMYVVMIVFNKKAEKIAGTENAVIQLVSAFIAVAVFVGIKQGFVIGVPEASWPWILLLGLLNTGIGCYLYFSPLSKLPVQTAAICGYLEPLSAIIFSSILLGETMTGIQVIGAVCIIGGAVFGEAMRTRALKKA